MKAFHIQSYEIYSFVSSPIEELNSDDAPKIKEFKEELRHRIQNVSLFPYSVHGLVKANYGGGMISIGSRTLIEANLVLTAAHNLYFHQKLFFLLMMSRTLKEMQQNRIYS